MLMELHKSTLKFQKKKNKIFTKHKKDMLKNQIKEKIDGFKSVQIDPTVKLAPRQ